VKLEMKGLMRLEQRMKLAPRMIQSMEILQLPILALQERIEQELNSNPVLEVDEPSSEEQADTGEEDGEKEPAPATDGKPVENFERIEDLGEDYKDYVDESVRYRPAAQSDEPDGKLEAIKNTAAPPQSLHDYLDEQWRLVEADAPVKKAGNAIIDYIDEKGYLTVRLEQFYNKDRADFTLDDLQKALQLVQKLEPVGVGARDLKECLLIQIDQSAKNMSFERRLIAEYMDKLLENRLPEIAKKMNCDINDIKYAIERISKLDTSPGLQISQPRNHPVLADIIVESSDDLEGYNVWLTDTGLPNLRVSDYYLKMSKSAATAEKARKFLQENIRSAQWIMDAIEQRRNTLLKVAKVIVKYQKEFFDKGQLYLKPLPMSKVAAAVGVHIATVSRAVAGKYLQCDWGILPLRKFFSGGTNNAAGDSYSWEAIRGKLQQIIDRENKANPLNDDEICKELAKEGITHLARRTVAKYRKLLSIPSAKLRKKY
jgi:RNA polymerase sigma-54 factor